MQPFHLAFPTSDLAATRQFMTDVLGVSIGRESEKWVDYDFFGHQVTSHLVPELAEAARNPVDGKQIPAFHFGIVLKWEDWEALVEKLETRGIAFVVVPYIRFKGEVGEQGTFFVREPGGSALEFKTFRNFDQLFAK